MKTAKTKPPKSASASALIIAVILTSLLAIIGVMFVMIARVDKMATSAISENKELNFAVEAVIAKISRELVLDVPGVAGAEYYDYPGEEDKWLASLEPYEKTTGNYYWRQISDVTGFLNDRGFSTQNVNVKPVGLITTVYVREYPVIRVDSEGRFLDDKTGNIAIDGVSADADGDGIADSKWIEVNDITSNKGKPIYAAIRVVDNGGMINVNTAYKFNPNETDSNLIDGSSQTQIDLEKLARGSDTIDGLADARNPLRRPLLDYLDGLIWRIEDPCSDYLPFDISDELELRNRFFLTSLAKTRLEDTWNSTIGSETFKRVPYDSDMAGWFAKFDPDSSEPDRRHLLTTCNMDRIIDPNGRKMLDINDANVSSVYNAIIDANLNITKEVAAQIAVNLKDYIDSDSNVTPFVDANGITYYGFERPCVYISEIAHRLRILAEPGPISYTLRRSYAIELYKPYPEDSYPEPNQWRLTVPGCPNSPFYINWSGTKHLHVVCLDDPCGPISPSVIFEPGDDDANLNSGGRIAQIITPIPYDIRVTSVSLERLTDTGWISVDSVTMPSWLVTTNQGTRSFKRDITLHKCIRRLWDTSGAQMGFSSPGQRSPSYVFSESPDIIIQAHPGDKPFRNVGEIGMLFCKSAYSQGPYPVGPNDTEATARLNLADPCYQNLFQYLTVFDPAVYSWNDPNETRIKGRININTAPWFVLAQLPWVSQRVGYNNTALAQAIVAYRDKLDLSSAGAGGPDYYHSAASNSRELETGITGISEANGFRSIGELMNVINKSGSTDYDVRSYGLDSQDQKGFPDLDEPSGDGAIDDFEERDLIFARISNLVTVRSDVFTAYILVRIGSDGPQKRVMAILDRSNVYSPTDKVRVVALHPVPDPR